jgi:GxxExxY protein
MSRIFDPAAKMNTEFTEDARKAQKAEEFAELSHLIIGACIEVQQQLGVGLLESAYANALAIELTQQVIRYQREYPIEAKYKDKPLGIVYKADFLVESHIILELKAIEALHDEHRAQLLTYLRLSNKRFGLLLNFHAYPIAKEGVKRVLNGY